MSPAKTALVVDDEADLRQVLAEYLREEGWRTIEAEDGDVAVAMAATQHPDVILLDIMMLGMDGFATFKELREDHRTAHIPVIFVSAINDMELGGHHDADSIAQRLGMPPPEAFIEKPFDASTIRQALTEIMGE